MTSGLMILLTNTSIVTLSLVSAEIVGSSSESELHLPKTFTPATFGGLGTKASDTPYKVLWTYTPDGGDTLLGFEVELSGPSGITIRNSATGPEAGYWALAEGPQLTSAGWLVRFFYGSAPAAG